MMKYYRQTLGTAAWLMLQCCCQAAFHTNTITTPGGAFAFTVDGVANNPTLNLTAGVTNIFVINTSSIHPVVVNTNSSVGARYSGASPQSITSGNITVNTTASGFPPKLFYVCANHGFFGEIDLSALVGPTPPRNLILSIQIGTNVVMKSTGTNATWMLIPEFSSNLVSGAWTPIPAYTNTFFNGTNTTAFNRLDPVCGGKVFLRIRQQMN